MSRGIDLGDAAMNIMSRLAETNPNIQQATAALDHLDGSKAELFEAIAYLGLQVNAYRRISNEDAHLALINVRSVLDQYDKRREVKVNGSEEATAHRTVHGAHAHS